jgi:hypothetical protein
MLEKDIEKKLKKEVEKFDGMCLKFDIPGRAGMPDRVILLPGSRIVFVELKRPGKNLRPLQKKRFKQLRDLGFRAVKIDSVEGVGELIDAIRTARIPEIRD